MYTPHPDGWPVMGVGVDRGQFRAWGRVLPPVGGAALRDTVASGRQDLEPGDELACAWGSRGSVKFAATDRTWRHLDGMLVYVNPQRATPAELAASETATRKQ
jgi:hypothetical protein